jgi:DNA-binding transcriptional MerR regulator
VVMNNDWVYSPAEICEMFSISKSTLFRWEREGWFPRVGRDLTGQRQYTQDHLRAISQKQKEQLAKQFERAAGTEDDAGLREIAEAVSLRKFLEGDMTGLYELAEYPQLSLQNIRQLLRTAMERCEPGEGIFCEIIRVVWEQGCKLSRAEVFNQEK